MVVEATFGTISADVVSDGDRQSANSSVFLHDREILLNLLAVDVVTDSIRKDGDCLISGRSLHNKKSPRYGVKGRPSLVEVAFSVFHGERKLMECLAAGGRVGSTCGKVDCLNHLIEVRPMAVETILEENIAVVETMEEENIAAVETMEEENIAAVATMEEENIAAVETMEEAGDDDPSQDKEANDDDPSQDKAVIKVGNYKPHLAIDDDAYNM
jgi:hypothetical protein